MAISMCQDIYQMLSRKYPNKNIYVIGDEHFFHSKIIDYSRTEFSDVDEMNEFIIKKHNEVVNKDDIVILLGDFSFKKALLKICLIK